MAMLPIIAVNNLVKPPEGSKAIPISISWFDNPFTNKNYYPINLTSQVQTGQFTRLQGMFVNNAQVIYPLRITIQDTGQIIDIAPFTCGYYPITSTSSPQIVVNLVLPYQNNNSTIPRQTTHIMLFNTPVEPYVWQSFFSNITGFDANEFSVSSTTPVALIGGVAGNWPIIFGVDAQMWVSNAAPVGAGANTVRLVDGSNGDHVAAWAIEWIAGQAVGSSIGFFSVNFPAGMPMASGADTLNLALANAMPGTTQIFMSVNVRYALVANN